MALEAGNSKQGAGSSGSGLQMGVLSYDTEGEQDHMSFFIETLSPIHQDSTHPKTLALHALTRALNISVYTSERKTAAGPSLLAQVMASQVPTTTSHNQSHLP